MRKLLSRSLLPLALLVILTLVLTRHLWTTRGWIETHDGIFHLIRLEAMATSLKAGVFPVRWIGSLDNGFGLPLFNYVYPGPYYLGAIPLLLGVGSLWVLKLVTIGFLGLGALGVYLSLARLSRPGALLASVFFLVTPYLLELVYVRGALGELAAVCLLPWVIASYLDLGDRGRFRWYHPLAFALLLLSHNFLSFLFLPLYLLLIFIRRRAVKPALLSLALSFGLASFFVLPLFLEQGYLTSVATGNFTYTLADHFVYFRQLVLPSWGHGHSVVGLGDGLSFQLGIPTLGVLLLAIFVAFGKKGSNLRLLLALALLIIFAMLPISSPLWSLLSPLSLIQFPWRLLSLMVVLTPYLVFLLFTHFPRIRPILLLLLLPGFFYAWQYSTPAYLGSSEQLERELYIHREKTTTSSRAELLPRWVDGQERWRGAEDLRIVSGNAEVTVIKSSPVNLVVSSSTQAVDTQYLLRRNYFPAWHLTNENGKKLPLTPSDNGEILFTPELGTHTYTLIMGSTMLESLSNLISFLALLLLVGLALKPRLKAYLDHRYQDWDLSIALRYLPIVDDLKKRLTSQDQVLEVGSEITGITPYLKRKITGVDQGFDYSRKNRYLTPVVGSATKLPFRDQSFDYVLSVDVLEHIPAKLREKAISEMLRVGKKRVYLTFPCGHKSEQVDRLLDEYFLARNGYHYTYLEEHVTLGLPPVDLVPKVARKHPEYRCQVYPNTSLFLWEFMLKFGLSNTPWKTSLYRRLLLLTPLLKHLNFPPTYRLLYVLTRESS